MSGHSDRLAALDPVSRDAILRGAKETAASLPNQLTAQQVTVLRNTIGRALLARLTREANQRRPTKPQPRQRGVA